MKKRGKARVEVDNTSIFLSDLLMMIDMIFMKCCRYFLENLTHYFDSRC